MNSIKIQCPAKINLTLKVLGKRNDGFHDIDSIMQTINLFDFLNISIEEAPFEKIDLTGNNPNIPYNEKNLVYKAAKLFIGKLSANKNYNISIDITKNIPVAAGLAGGSTDAAGTIFGLNELLKHPFNKNELHKMCSELGSDLNFCLEGGTQQTLGRGEILKPLDFKKKSISLIKPINLGISAKEAYTKFAQKSASTEVNREKYVNDLEWAIIDDYSELQQIKTLYPEAIMSGSGSTYFIENNEFKETHGFWVKNNLQTIPYGVKEV